MTDSAKAFTTTFSAILGAVAAIALVGTAVVVTLFLCYHFAPPVIVDLAMAIDPVLANRVREGEVELPAWLRQVDREIDPSEIDEMQREIERLERELEQRPLPTVTPRLEPGKTK